MLLLSFQRFVLSSRVRWIAAVMLLQITALTRPAVAGDRSPPIRFDVANMIACRDITTAEFLAANPHERLMEARIQVSVLSELRPEQSLAELLVRIESPDRTTQVFDYFPKTTLASAFLGPLEVEQHRERAKSVEVNAQAQSLAASAGSRMSEQEKSTFQLHGQKLPPMELMAASGTVQRGAGVYFKLRPSPRTAIEGGQDFLVLFRVPEYWRADHLIVSCEAFGDETNLLAVPSRVRWSARSFVVAMHREGDVVARQRAAGLLRAEWELRSAAELHQHRLDKQTRTDPIREIESLFKRPKEKLPANWMEQVLFTGTSGELEQVHRQLPDDVRIAAMNYRDAKRQLHRLGEHRTTHVVAKPPVTDPAATTAEANAAIERLPAVQ